MDSYRRHNRTAIQYRDCQSWTALERTTDRSHLMRDCLPCTKELGNYYRNTHCTHWNYKHTHRESYSMNDNWVVMNYNIFEYHNYSMWFSYQENWMRNCPSYMFPEEEISYEEDSIQTEWSWSQWLDIAIFVKAFGSKVMAWKGAGVYVLSLSGFCLELFWEEEWGLVPSY